MLDKRLVREIVQNRTYMGAMVLQGVFQFIFSVINAFLLSDMIQAVFLKKEPYQTQYIKLGFFFILILAKALFTYVIQGYLKREAAVLKNKLLIRAIDHLFEEGPIKAKQRNSGGMVSSWLEAAEEIEPFYSEYLPQFVSLIITVPLLLVLSFFVDIVSACIMLVTGPLLPFFLSLIGIQSKEANQKRLSRLSELSGSMLDFLTGIETLKIFQGLETYRKILEKNSDDFRRETMQVLKIAFLSAFVLEFAATISTALIAVSLGLRLLYRQMEFFPALFILLLTPDYYMAIRKFGAKFHTAMGARAGADTLIFEESDLEFQKTELPIELRFDQIDVHLKNVSYAYEGATQNAVTNLTMDFENRKVTALVGKSGSGKSTIAYLILQYICGSGDIFFEQTKVNVCNVKSIQKLISYIPQKPFIFQDSLRNNLILAKKDATTEELDEAIVKANLSDFVRRLPKGYDTVLKELGTSISVGEAQRIGMARAYLKNAPIFILDEITSALDLENERFFIEQLKQLKEHKTVILIAHRLETVKNADFIYVLKDGKIQETGTHESLQKEDGIYKELIETWGESS